MQSWGLSEVPLSDQDPALIKVFDARAEALVWVSVFVCGDPEHKCPSAGRMDLPSFLQDKSTPACHPNHTEFTQLLPNPVTKSLFFPQQHVLG